MVKSIRDEHRGRARRGAALALLAALWMLPACGDDDGSEATDGGAEAGADAGAEAGEEGWSSYGYDLSNTQVYAGSSMLNADNVKDLAPKWRARVNGGASSTPAIVDGTAYFGDWNGFLYAFDVETAELTWKVALGRQYIRDTPLVTEDRVYVGVDRSLAAVSREDGEILFQTELVDHPQGIVESSPKLADGVIVIGVASLELGLEKDEYTFVGAVLGLDADDGKVLWRVPVTGDGDGPCTGGAGVSVWSSAAIDPELGLAYIGTGQTYVEPASTCNDTLLAIHYAQDHSGERIAWQATYTENDVYLATGTGLMGLDHDIGAAPNLFMAGDVAAVGVGDKGGSYRVFDRESGEQLWRVDLQTSGFAQLGGVMTTAAVYEGTILVTSNMWGAFGFILDGNHAPEDFSWLYALDAETGEEQWKVQLDAPTFGTFAVANGLLFHATIRGDVYAHEVSSGEERFKHSLETAVGSGISLTQNGLYLSGGFSLGGEVPRAEVVGFGLSPERVRRVDLREEETEVLTEAQCDAALTELDLDADCRSCLCECDATATGSCGEACWGQASCVADSCADVSFEEAEGTACYEENCSNKLLPPDVYRESIASATCVQTCTTRCGL